MRWTACLPWTSLPTMFLCVTSAALAAFAFFVPWVQVNIGLQSPTFSTSTLYLGASSDKVLAAAAATGLIFNLIGAFRSRVLTESSALFKLLFLADIGVIVAFGLLWNWYCYRLAERTVQSRLEPPQKLLSVQVITTTGYGFCLVSHIGFCISLMCSTLCTCCCKEAVQRGESELEPLCGLDDSDRQRLHDDPAQNADAAHGHDDPRANRSSVGCSKSTEDPRVAIQTTDLRTVTA